MVGTGINAARPIQSDLSLAVRGGHHAQVQWLLNAGEDSHILNASGQSLIEIAALHGHLRVVQCLFTAAGEDFCTGKEAVDALASAALKGNIDIVRYLLGTGVGPSFDALCSAAVGGHLDVVRCLVVAGADCREAAACGMTPLFCATNGGHILVRQYLISVGAASAVPKVYPDVLTQIEFWEIV